MEFEEFEIDDDAENKSDIENSEHTKDTGEQETNEVNENTGYEGVIRPYMFEPIIDIIDEDPSSQHEVESIDIQRNDLLPTEWYFLYTFSVFFLSCQT